MSRGGGGVGVVKVGLRFRGCIKVTMQTTITTIDVITRIPWPKLSR